MSDASRPKLPKRSAAHGRRGSGGEDGDATVARPVDPIDVGRYIAEICSGLSDMSNAAQLPLLTYLLGMAQQEADRIAKSGLQN